MLPAAGHPTQHHHHLHHISRGQRCAWPAQPPYRHQPHPLETGGSARQGVAHHSIPAVSSFRILYRETSDAWNATLFTVCIFIDSFNSSMFFTNVCQIHCDSFTEKREICNSCIEHLTGIFFLNAPYLWYKPKGPLWSEMQMPPLTIKPPCTWWPFQAVLRPQAALLSFALLWCFLDNFSYCSPISINSRFRNHTAALKYNSFANGSAAIQVLITVHKEERNCNVLFITVCAFPSWIKCVGQSEANVQRMV